MKCGGNNHGIDISRAERPTPRKLRRHTLEQDGRRYTAFDCHSLLEHENEADRSRPGHPLG